MLLTSQSNEYCLVLTDGFWRQPECCDALEDIIGGQTRENISKSCLSHSDLRRKLTLYFLTSVSRAALCHLQNCPSPKLSIQITHKENVLFSEQYEISVCHVFTPSKMTKYLIAYPDWFFSSTPDSQGYFCQPSKHLFCFVGGSLYCTVRWARKLKKSSSFHFSWGLWDCMSLHRRAGGLDQKSHHSGNVLGEQAVRMGNIWEW